MEKFRVRLFRFVHYRRYFTKKGVTYKDSINIDAVILDKDDIEKMLEVSNVIVPKKESTI